MHYRFPLVLVVCCTMTTALAGPAEQQYQRRPNGRDAKRVQKNAEDVQTNTASSGPRSIVLTESRSYQLDVEKLQPNVSVTIAKQWVFARTFPPKLLSAIKQHARIEKPKQEPFLDPKAPRPDSGYIRWESKQKSAAMTGAVLWYVNGTKRKELAISTHLMLDHTLGKNRLLLKLSFNELRGTAAIEESKIRDIRFSDIPLPDRSSETQSVVVEDVVQVRVVGTLTTQSYNSVKSADRLLGDGITRKLLNLGRVNLTNDSHHGIRLGWLGYDGLRHGLVFFPAQSDGVLNFQYLVSGSSFPISLVRRQLRVDGWPLVLRGHEYLGSSKENVGVFRPVEYVLSRPSPKPANK